VSEARSAGIGTGGYVALFFGILVDEVGGGFGKRDRGVTGVRGDSESSDGGDSEESDDDEGSSSDSESDSASLSLHLELSPESSSSSSERVAPSYQQVGRILARLGELKAERRGDS